MGPALREGEIAAGWAHICLSFDDTFVHVASGREIAIRVAGGTKATADREEASATMLVA